ncbi:hypothetical protein EVAR_2784_1 [Eumeta japonica]|uniref:Uncharacterized protein n=1 Tax=Eumeta variegata TaxID=151549 RepID=A0A4C1T0E4_EUMVA|nr:hypothetical protein EVAR_2784_1 [Eumeta japonica]
MLTESWTSVSEKILINLEVNMGTELPKNQESSGESDSNTDSENSSNSDSSSSDRECTSKDSNKTCKPHFSVTSCDTGLKLKIAAIPRKAATKNTGRTSTVKKRSDDTTANKCQNNKKEVAKTPVKGKIKSQLSESSTSSGSCSKCSSDSSSEDDLPLKTVSKQLPPKRNNRITKTTKNTLRDSDSDNPKKNNDCKDNQKQTPKEKQNAVKPVNNNSKKGKCENNTQETPIKRGRGRPRTKPEVRAPRATPTLRREATSFSHLPTNDT